jgi:hypothetical protein
MRNAAKYAAAETMEQAKRESHYPCPSRGRVSRLHAHGLPPVGREIQMAKRDAPQQREPLRVPREPRLEFVVRRLPQLGHVLEEELHLLDQPAPDDRIIFVQAECQRLAVEDLLADVALDQAVQLLGGDRPALLPRPPRLQARHLGGGDLDHLRGGGRVAVPARGVQPEQQRPDQEKVQEGLVEQSRHAARRCQDISAAVERPCRKRESTLR